MIRQGPARLPRWADDGGNGSSVELSYMTEESSTLVSIFLEDDFDLNYNAAAERFTLSFGMGWMFISGSTMYELVRKVKDLIDQNH